jgi:adenylate kinase family enzyme
MPPVMPRFSVVGPTGSGKSTVAAAIGARLGIPVLGLDEVHWGPEWTPRDRETIREEVAVAVACDAWVVDGNYRRVVQDLVWAAADTIVWLDLPFRSNAAALVRRTWRRIRQRTALWAGNRETLRRALSSRESILWWLIKTHRSTKLRYERDSSSGEWPHLVWVRLRSRSEMEAWLARLDS